MTRDEFLTFLGAAIEAGHISDLGCATHGTLETTVEEQEAFEDGYDACMHAVRVWPA